jgi:hypothetical protein
MLFYLHHAAVVLKNVACSNHQRCEAHKCVAGAMSELSCCHSCGNATSPSSSTHLHIPDSQEPIPAALPSCRLAGVGTHQQDSPNYSMLALAGLACSCRHFGKPRALLLSQVQLLPRTTVSKRRLWHVALPLRCAKFAVVNFCVVFISVKQTGISLTLHFVINRCRSSSPVVV